MVLIAAIMVTACKKELKVNEPGNLVPKTVTGDASISAIEVNGARLHAETFGTPTDPMVVILHGGPGADSSAGIALVGPPAVCRGPSCTQMIRARPRPPRRGAPPASHPLRRCLFLNPPTRRPPPT